MKRIIFFPFLFFFVFSFSQKIQVVNSDVKYINIYNNTTELKHQAKVNLAKGYQEIVITNIAENVNENSIIISSSNNINILSYSLEEGVTDQEQEIATKNRSKIANDSISILQKKVSLLQNENSLTNGLLEILRKNESIFNTNSSSNVAELSKLIDYNKQKRTELLSSYNKNNEEISKLNSKIEKLRNYSNSGFDKSENRILISLESDNAVPVTFNISYLTNDASWKPYYSINIDKINAPINLSYKAKIIQDTKIDWKNVKLRLTSGNASTATEAHNINKWFLYYNEPESYRSEAVSEKQIESVVIGYSTRRINQNQLNVTFDIDKVYNLPSRDEEQLVDITDMKIPASYKYIAIPKYDLDVYLVAEINNYSQYNLLPGEANIIFEGTYVGKTNIKPQQTEENLKISLGKDKNIAVKRELITDKSGEKTLSSYKEQNYVYEISVRNNKKERAEVELKDQIPVSTDKEMTIKMLDKDGAELNIETGILTWNLKLNSNETKKIRFGFKVKYPKDKQIPKIN